MSDIDLNVEIIEPTTSAPPDGTCSGNCVHNHTTIAAAATWTKFSFNWTDFTDGNIPLNPSDIQGVSFVTVPQTSGSSWGFDVWIDDVSYMSLTGDCPATEPEDGSDRSGNGQCDYGATTCSCSTFWTCL